ncbi:MAG: tRNA pseudouridine(13) synthase TruD [Sulfolobales archaeon]
MVNRSVRCVESSLKEDLFLKIECYETGFRGLEAIGRINSSNFKVFEVSRIHGTAGEVYLPSEDFYRYPMYPPSSSYSSLHIYILKKKDLDTFQALRRVKRITKAERVFYLGLKDKSAETFQFIALDKVGKFMPYYYSKDLELYFIGLDSRRRFKRDILAGNCFLVDLSEIIEEPGGRAGEVLEILSTIKDIGFIPNYYSYQRFGLRRMITHLVGRYIIRGDLERAMEKIICYPQDTCDTREKCKEILESRHRWMWIEKIICRDLEREPIERIFSKIPRRINLLFVEAYLSYLFNSYLSKRWKLHGLSFHRLENEVECLNPLSGIKTPCISIKLDKKGADLRSINKYIFYEVSEELQEKLRYEVIRKLTGLKRIVIKRSLVCPLSLIEVDGLKIKFCLDRGCYATNLLRELFKENISKIL